MCGLMPTRKNGILELTRMVILPKERGQKIGQRLLQYCIDFAKTNNLHGLLLYSSTKLENAIYLYRKYGFKDLQLEEDCPYKRSDIKMILKLWCFIHVTLELSLKSISQSIPVSLTLYFHLKQKCNLLKA